VYQIGDEERVGKYRLSEVYSKASFSLIILGPVRKVPTRAWPVHHVWIEGVGA
jgi:hypothetical protein